MIIEAKLELQEIATENPHRRLAYRFLTLPFRHQIAIANTLGILTDEDRKMGDDELFRVLFKRAGEQGLLKKLWDETEKHYPPSGVINPFEACARP